MIQPHFKPSSTVNIQVFEFLVRNPPGKLRLYMECLNVVPEQDCQMCKRPVTKFGICWYMCCITTDSSFYHMVMKDIIYC